MSTSDPQPASATHERPTRNQVVALFTTMLDRAPESESVIQGFMKLGSVEDVAEAIAGSPEFKGRRSKSSPFFHYKSMFDAEGLILRHGVSGLSADPRYFTNYLGVKIDPKFLPGFLAGAEGKIDPAPIPANWHADIAEWAAALRAVELAEGSFTIAELGCGWGCWMNITGAAARNCGLDVRLVGVEGDAGHLQFAKESTAANGFSADQIVIHHGIAAATDGVALFPRQDTAGEHYGLAPVFRATDAQRETALASGAYEELPMIPITALTGDGGRLDLLHIDIQGGEADLVSESADSLDERVAYMVIGTHSREIEGRICAALLKRGGWRLEVERPAIVELGPEGPLTVVDGVQGWRNMALLPE